MFTNLLQAINLLTSIHCQAYTLSRTLPSQTYKSLAEDLQVLRDYRFNTVLGPTFHCFHPFYSSVADYLETLSRLGMDGLGCTSVLPEPMLRTEESYY